MYIYMSRCFPVDVSMQICSHARDSISEERSFSTDQSYNIAKLLEAYILVTITKQDESLNICNSIIDKWFLILLLKQISYGTF